MRVAPWLALASLLVSTHAFGQAQPTGRFTPGHAIRANTSSGTPYSDAGGSSGSPIFNSGYLTEIGITATGTPFCINDALTSASGGYHQLCLGANALGGGLLSYNALGGASPLSLDLEINGVRFAFPTAGSGNVVGPSSPFATSGHVAKWGGGLTLVDGGTIGIQNNSISGCTLSNDGVTPATVIDVAVCQATDSTNAAVIYQSVAFTKSISSTFVAGTGGGCLGAGVALTASTTYHIILAENGTSADYYCDTSPTGANRPAAITDPLVRRVGSIRTDSSSHILAFTQNRNEFLWASPPVDFNGSLGFGDTTLAVSVPTGIIVNALFSGQYSNANSPPITLWVSSPAVTSGNFSEIVTQVTGQAVGLGQLNIRTNTSGQVVFSAAAASGTLGVRTIGWIDNRGQQ